MHHHSSPNLSFISGEELFKSQEQPTTLHETLHRTTTLCGQKQGIIYLGPDGSEIYQSYEDLWKDALRIVRALQNLDLRPKEKVILLLEENKQFITALWGGILAGVVVVPLAAPSKYDQSNSGSKKLEEVWKFLNRPLVITNRDRQPELKKWAQVQKLEQFHVQVIEDLLRFESASSWHFSKAEDLALLFFTSGSTGTPKAVMLNHENLLNMVQGMIQMHALSDQDITFNWMPFDHVAAIAMMHLPPIYLGYLQINVSTQTILLDPLKWLDWMNHYRATITWAPNFAFGLITDYSEEIKIRKWDLSSIRYMFNGGEAVGAKVGRRFLELLEPKGLPPTALCPAWGMSETSSGVIYSHHFSRNSYADHDPFVEIGSPIPGFSIRIVDEHNQILPEGTVGGLQVLGPSVTQGYFLQPELNQIAFTKDGWFDTGDCGFIKNGGLTLTGRSNDSIIINGVNYYSHVIEASLDELSEVVSSYTAACAVREAHDITDQLAIFFVPSVDDELQLPQLLRKISYHISQSLGISPKFLLPVEKERIPKTTIGKIQRSQLKKDFEKGAFSSLLKKLADLNQLQEGNFPQKRKSNIEIHHLTKEDIQNDLLYFLKEDLSISGQINADTNIHSLGINSLLMFKLIRIMEKQYRIKIQARVLFQYSDVTSLASYITEKIQTNAPSDNELTVQVEEPVTTSDRSLVNSLSEVQKGLWAIQKISPKMSAYHLPLCFQIASKIDIEKLKQAFQFVLEQYPILTSRIEESKGMPSLKEQIAMLLPVFVEDVSAIPEQKIFSLIREKVKEQFSLTEGPLIRMYLFSCSEEKHFLLFLIHHIVFDGVSSLIFLELFFKRYQALLQGQNFKISSPSTSFSDFVRWEKAMLSSRIAEEHSSYWKRQLSEVLAQEPLFKQPSWDDFVSPQTYSQSFSDELIVQLRGFAKSHSKNVSTILLGVYLILLHRYSGREDIVVGMPVSIRPEDRFEGSIGLFLNMIPVREVIPVDDSFLEFLNLLQLNLFDHLEHAVYPFPRIIRDLKGSSEKFSFLQAAFFYQNFFQSNSYKKICQKYQKTLSLDFVKEIHQEGEFPLLFEIWEETDEMSLTIKYHPDVFTPFIIENMFGHYLHLLEEMLENPNCLIKEYSLLPEKEKKILLNTWNNTQTDYPDLCWHALFEQQVKKTPEAIAVVCEDGSLTYFELNEKSESLARYLQTLGVGPETLVGICVERCLDMIVGMLGILKAGGAYIPLDPTYPQTQLDYILEDSQALFILTQSSFKSKYPNRKRKLKQRQVIFLDEEWDNILHGVKDHSLLKKEITSHHLAYVIYTSGSTGKPKGVMIPHKAVTNFLLSMKQNPGFSQKDKLLALTTYNFDIAALELFLPLISGAQCYIYRSDSTKNPQQLQSIIQTIRPTCMQATPATWTMLFNSGWNNEEGIKILCGGEALPAKLKKSFIASKSEAWNMFGPTETTIWSTLQLIQENEPITIGKPIFNTQVYILDKYLQPLPIGQAGELHIAGDGLARGYWNNPELTAQKFIENPFTPGTKLYKTGDFARWLQSGQIEYLGRLDHQVKIRGFRIELGAVESHVGSHPGISENVTVVKQEGDHKKLVTYYVPKKDASSVPSEQLRAYLQTRLPDYMVPSHFIPLSALPLTPNGKVNRKELEKKEITLAREEKQKNYSEIERKILAIWQEVLHVQDIGVEEGFFDVGGDSLLAVTVVERIKKELACTLSVTELFTYPNVRSISQYLSKQTASAPVQLLKDKGVEDSVAIIGISCSFPGAKDARAFWKNLREGKESVRFFTKNELTALGISEKLIENPHYVPIQSSMEGKDLFDPEFFQLSPKDAEMMDPQLRLLLMHSWKAIEDGGYAPKKIPDTSVYMSASHNSYSTLLSLEDKEVLESSDGYVAWVLSQSGSIPTMISHKLGLKGPSYFVHSNCSSSLVGLYNAYQILKAGESTYALVGASTLHVSSNIGYVHQNGMNFSSDGHIKAFDAQADGMLAGEGVAVILLKKTVDAVRDGDHIYSILRGIAVNNDGAEKVGFYAPSVQGQSAVIEKVLNTTGIDPQSICYVEAHGTGTKLGDPIELAALSQAYRAHTNKTQFCGIGSVKTNMGHLDTAAGLAGCIKIALSLSHHELVPTLNYKEPNPQLDLDNSPFYVMDKNRTLEKEKIHRAALSSFGVGGTNVHAIFEQYIPQKKPRYGSLPWLIPLSAKNEERLRDYVQEFLDYLDAEGEESSLENIAYTLQVGREAMKSRAIFLVENITELKEQLTNFLRGEKGLVVEEQIAKDWSRGMEVEWQSLYPNGKPDRMSMPTYPFAKKRFWPQPKNIEKGTGLQIHPMVHRNTSTLSEQRFSSTFTGQEYFIAEHIIRGATIVPAVVTLEMARVAVEAATESTDVLVKLKNVVWIRPLVVDKEPLQVHIDLIPEEKGQIHYRMYQASNGESLLCNQGLAEICENKESGQLDLKSIQKRCNENKILAKPFYEGMIGADYGPSYKVVREVYLGQGALLAKLSLPPSAHPASRSYILHPSMMDGALQVAEYLQNITRFKTLSAKGKSFHAAVPFALKEMEILKPCVSEMWVHVQFNSTAQEKEGIQNVDIDICDEAGTVCVRIRDFSIREIEGEVHSNHDSIGTLLLEPQWKEHEGEKEEDLGIEYVQHFVFLCEIERSNSSLELPEAEIYILDEREASIDARFGKYAGQLFEKVQDILRKGPKGPILVQLVIPGEGEGQLFAGLYGLLKTARWENSNLLGQLIEIDSSKELTKILKENKKKSAEQRLRYKENTRYLSEWKEASNVLTEESLPWKEEGVYLITGGAGGLGLIFAKEIATRAKNSSVILVGRTPSNKVKELPPSVRYKQVDVTSKEEVAQLIKNIHKEYGHLEGIIHAAGIIKDNYIHNKTQGELNAVLAPKVAGLVNLDEATKQMDLDFMIFFSSTSGSVGNAGQADYASANAFMDAYAGYRTKLVGLRQRTGRTLSINWPLWKEGGMQVNAHTEKMLLQNTGMIPMETAKGVQAFYQGWNSRSSQIMVLAGQLQTIKEKLLYPERAFLFKTKKPLLDAPVEGLIEKVKIYLKKEMSKLLKLKGEEIEDHIHMTQYGLESISMIEFINALNQKYTLGLIPTIFFEYPTLEDFSQYLVREHHALLAPHFALLKSTSVPSEEKRPEQKPFRRKERFVSPQQHTADPSEPIAIIGISGIFPMAKDVDEYWENLMQGKDCITEVPLERWDWREYEGDPAKERNKTRVRWGGFMNSLAEFDPLFFGISPREAELMDPQHRLTLTQVWKALEDAGYTSRTIAGTRVAVFIGTGNTGYSALVARENLEVDGSVVANMGPAAGPNRISYFLNIHGPSEPIDTACSSSLVAMHHAINALEYGDCTLAIAGGINTILLPEVYIAFDKAGALSHEGKCKTFSDKADGFVHGEGAGILILKKLSLAEKDGDHIYGIIRSSVVNHGGHASSVTAPNPNAQADLLVAAYQKSKIDPSTVTYIEAHGTGTELGDPIEVKGLISAFKRLNTDFSDSIMRDNYCGMGSVKSNIGHLSLAAGVAGMIKVLLQLKYKTLVKSLHCETIHPYIQLKETPFYVVQEKQEWKALMDSQGKDLPRRAGVSSFGIGGVNAHVVIEEYLPQKMEGDFPISHPVIFLLSAKNEKQLKSQAQQFLEAIEKKKFLPIDLINIAYTLQIGREAMEERVGLIVSSLDELHEKLKLFVQGQDTIEDVFRGKSDKGFLQKLLAGEEIQEAIIKWMERKKYSKLLELWVRGLNVEWEKLYGDHKPKRVPLPTYPFARERYWVESHPSALTLEKTNSPFSSLLHPLLHSNVSNLLEQRFRSTFNGKEFFLKEHVIKGKCVLPGVAHLEMAREALERAMGILPSPYHVIHLKNIVWVRPIVLEQSLLNIDIALYPEQSGDISYEIFSNQNEENNPSVLHSQGSGNLFACAEIPRIDVLSLQEKCHPSSFSIAEMYDTYKRIGFGYGPTFQGIETIYLGEDFVLAKMGLPPTLLDPKTPYVLHPGMMDAALHVSSLLVGTKENQLMLPFALEEIEIYSKCTSSMWVFARLSEGNKSGDQIQKRSVDLCDPDGNVCVRIKGLSFRAAEGEIHAKATLIFEPIWKDQEIERQEDLGIDYVQHLVFLCEIDKRHIPLELPDSEIHLLDERGASIDERFGRYASQLLEKIQSILQQGPKGPILMQLVIPHQGEGQLFAGLYGLLKTARLENSNLMSQLIEIDSSKELTKILKENKEKGAEQHFRYKEDKRCLYEWKEVSGVLTETIPWKEEGVYLITGGMGGLGQIFAKEINARAKNSFVILAGRSPFDKVKELSPFMIYKQVNVTSKAEVAQFIKNIQEEYGHLDGIIHAAGVIKDNYIHNKTEKELRAVCAPKVAGLVNLDEATKHMKLDFMIFFSSGAAARGSAGQADYSMANAFMDAYAHYRNQLVASKQRFGKTLSINWPLWKEGGMHIDAHTEKMLLQNAGIIPMETAEGIQAFYKSMQSKEDQVLIVEGVLSRIKQKMSERAPQSVLHPVKKVNLGDLSEKLISALIQHVSKLLKIKREEIDIDKEFQQYGFDSITLTEFTNLLNAQYGLKLTPTLFFEYQTLRRFTSFLAKEYEGILANQFAISTPSLVSPNTREKEPSIPLAQKAPRFLSSSLQPKQEKGVDTVAIIGISGVFPMAKDLDEFWENLKEGRDCITEIPRERWDWREFYGDPAQEANKTNVKWGGFIDSVAEFDPLFFGISPKEAEIMDPEQRLALTYVWKAIEDAGYSGQSISGTNTAIFLGIGNTGYSSLLARSQIEIEGTTAANMSPSVGPNRISYFLNIHGPSEPIDTACSSSLVAIHHAAAAILEGNCTMAIAGGINTVVAPEGHIAFDKAGALSKEGRCKTFSDKADGFAVGEGAGIVVLKKLSAAEQDGDHIYGVIRSAVINHGGRANSLTTPNPNAQANLLIEAYTRAGVDPTTVTYIETHGTGTPLGDPVEINGLKSAFKQLSQNFKSGKVVPHSCGLGSVKTNIGHLSLAAGMASVLKVLFQLKYKMLVQSLHCETLNPYIQLEDSPFYVLQKKQEWKALKDGQGKEIPRRTGVSSFGIGGVNAHVVIEEYLPKEKDLSLVPTSNPVIIVLSAKNEKQLIAQVEQLLHALQMKKYTDSVLPDMAYTLQVGRDAMEERLSLLVNSVQQLEEKLTRFIEKQGEIEELFRGRVDRGTLQKLLGEEEIQEAIAKWIERKKYVKLMDLWVKGLNIDWNKLYEYKPKKISLPTYPFARERYWVEENPLKVKRDTLTASILHPLLHYNISDLSEQRFRCTFSGGEFFLTDHRVKGNCILPAVTYLEMAREAAVQSIRNLSQSKGKIHIKNVAWIQPLIVTMPTQVDIILDPQENGELNYEIYTEHETERRIYHQGKIAISPVEQEIPMLNLKKCLAECNESFLSAEKCYELFQKIGLAYGPSHQGIERLYSGTGQALAKLILPACLSGKENPFVLHPAILDAALQASIGLKLHSNEQELSLPFALDELEIFDRCVPEMWAHVRYSRDKAEKVRKMDIDLCNDQGAICVRFKGISSRTVEKRSDPFSLKTSAADSHENLLTSAHLLAPVWTPLEKNLPFTNIGQGEEVVVIGINCPILKKHDKKVERVELEAHDSIEAIAKKIAANPPLKNILWIAPSPSEISDSGIEMIEDQEKGVIQLFRIMKALLLLGYGEADISWTIVTHQTQYVYPTDRINPTHASVHGLIGSMAKEYSNWKARLIDLEDDSNSLPEEIFTLPFNAAGDVYAYRSGEWVRQTLLPAQVDVARASKPTHSLYKKGGVYVVIGGAGGIGEVWSEYVIQNYQAHVIWIGRREENALIQEKIERLANLGPRPLYIEADATEKEALHNAHERIKKTYPHINGVIHSAIVLKDMSLAQMDEKSFRAVLSAKVDVSVQIAQVFKKEELDFILFFSSLQSFVKAAGQSNYASGCTFKDAFAHKLFHEWTCAVKVMNWGFWGTVGIVSSTEYKERMKKAGIGSIEPEEAMEALELLLATPFHQIALIKIDSQNQEWNRETEEYLEVYTEEETLNIEKLKDYNLATV